MTATPQNTAVYPVTIWQQYVLDEFVHPLSTDALRDRLTLANAVLFRPGIDMRRTQRAVDKLRQRHDSLRIRFDQVKGGFRALIEPPTKGNVREIDLGDQDDAAFYAEISAIAHAPMPVLNAPLAEVIVARCGSRGDVLITRVHHAITDGYGMVVLAEDLTKYLIGLPVFGKAVSHADYIARFQSALPSRAAEIDAYWETLHRDLPQTPNVGRKGKGMPTLINGLGKVEPRQIVFTASPASLRRFEERSNAANISSATAFFASHLEALCECYDLEKMVYMTSAARSDPALGTYVGDHTLDPIMPYVPMGAKNLAGATKKLNGDLYLALANLPSEAARRGTPYEASLVDRGINPRQFALYQPRPAARQNKSLLRSGFNAEYGQEIRIGPLRVTQLDVSVRHRCWAEMRFNVGSSEVNTGFTLDYDGIAYTEDEVRMLGHKTCTFLDLEPTDVVAS